MPEFYGPADSRAQQVVQALQVDPHGAAELLREDLRWAPSAQLAGDLLNKVNLWQDPYGAGHLVEYQQNFGPGIPGQMDITIASQDPISGQPRQELVTSVETPPPQPMIGGDPYAMGGYAQPINPLLAMEGMFIFGAGYGMGRFAFDRHRLMDCNNFEGRYGNTSLGLQFSGSQMPIWNSQQRTPNVIPQPVITNIYNSKTINNNTINNTINEGSTPRPVIHPVLPPGGLHSVLPPGSQRTIPGATVNGTTGTEGTGIYGHRILNPNPGYTGANGSERTGIGQSTLNPNLHGTITQPTPIARIPQTGSNEGYRGAALPSAQSSQTEHIAPKINVLPRINAQTAPTLGAVRQYHAPEADEKKDKKK